MSTNTATMNSQGKQDKLPCFGQRHLVVVIVFLVASMLTGQRIIMSVTIVKMVNHTAVVDMQMHISHNVTTCPRPNITASIKVNKDSGVFEWNSQTQGIILGAHTFGYLFGMLPSGKMAELLGAKYIIFWSNLIASIFGILTPLAAWWNLYALITTQFLKGLAQGFGFPASYVMMANWYPPKERVLLSPWLGFGFPFGGVLASSLTGYICDSPRLGWPWAFYIVGGVNFVLAIVILFVYFETPQKHPRISNVELKYITESLECDLSKKRPPTPWKLLFTSVPMYALTFALFGFFWKMSYFTTVHALYMGTILHYPIAENGLISSLPMFFAVLGGFCASLFSSWFAKHNYLSITTLRKGCHVIGSLGFAISILVIIPAGCNQTLNLIFFLVGSFFGGFPFTTMSTVPVDMSPVFAGTMMSFISVVCTIGSILVPVITGGLTKNELPSEWHNVFILTASITIVTAIIFAIFGSAEIQHWNFVEEDHNRKEISKPHKQETTVL